jgi:uncharacterized protein YecA (UPF0149 family)
MNVYNYHPVTKEFLSQGTAEPNPITPDSWLIPAHATTIEPPEFGDNQITVFNEESKAWEIITIVPYQPTYTELRVEEYPSIFDYIDGVVKGDQAQIDKYIKDCLAVKEKYPKTKNEV